MDVGEGCTVAGDWIKMRSALCEDPDVIRIAAATNLDEFGVVGRLLKFWGWADSHTTDGNASSVTGALAFAWLDRYLSAPGFATALVSVNWLSIDDDGIHLLNFDRHNGETGKQRALTAKRAARFKAKSNATSNGAGVTPALPVALPTEEKRREDSISHKDKSFTKKRVFQVPDVDEVRAYCAERKNGIDPEKFVDHYTASGWKLSNGNAVKDWRACVRTWEKNPLNKKPSSRLPTPEEDALWNPIDGGLGL